MKGKSIVVCVTGGIAAYKAAELVRLLVREEAVVRVAMTANGARFVSPLTFEALSGNRVLCDMWGPDAGAMGHISWGQEAELVIVAPATANFIGKMANGIGDDFASTMLLAATAPVLVCPSMNVKMFENPVVQENLEALKGRGLTVMAPGTGQLACRAEGAGRLPEPPEILEEVRRLLSPQDLSGMRLLVTAGPTVEPLDPVRHLTNRSSGKMGYAVARAGWRRGARVVLVSGPTGLDPPRGVDFKPVRSAREMRDVVLALAPETHVIVKAAAVADYRPRETAGQKIKKGPQTMTLELEKNPDILAELGRGGVFSGVLVGFAAETEELLANAETKLQAKNLDMIVANDVSRKDAGFDADTNAVKILFRDGGSEETPLLGKEQVADFLLDRIKGLWEERFGRS